MIAQDLLGKTIGRIIWYAYTKSINKLFYLNSDILAKSSREAELVLDQTKSQDEAILANTRISMSAEYCEGFTEICLIGLQVHKMHVSKRQ